jgi:hypothetical protein
MRALAGTMTDPNAAIPNDLAADHDKLAEKAAVKANGKNHCQTASRQGEKVKSRLVARPRH